MGFWVEYKGKNRAYCNVTTKPTSMENTTKTTKSNIAIGYHQSQTGGMIANRPNKRLTLFD